MINKILKQGEKVNVGLTNDNYTLIKDNNKYMVRIPKEDVKDIFNREAEESLLNELKKTPLTINPVYFDHTGIQITPFIDALLTFDQYHKPDRIEKVVALMQQFHHLKTSSTYRFDPIHKLNQYYEKSQTNFDLTPYQQLLTAVNKHQQDAELIMCHNDWVAGNICFKDDETYLIDFEYAALNHPYFDIMSFYTENDLTEEEKVEYLHLHFPNGIHESDMKLLIMYRDFNNLLWLMWAKMMYHLRKDKIYKTIESIKYKQLHEEYQKPLNY